MRFKEILEAMKLDLSKGSMMTVPMDGSEVEDDLEDDEPAAPKPLKLRGFGRSKRAGTPGSLFIDEIGGKYDTNPLNEREFVIDNVAVLEIRPDPDFDDAVEIGNLRSFVKGGGKTVMTMLCEMADRMGVTMNLYAMGYAQVPTLKLVEYYQRFGFEVGNQHELEIARKHPNEDVGVDMQRKPR